ncbi:MAG: hypothetical protein ABI888_01015 [Chloroflexota bacterium]
MNHYVLAYHRARRALLQEHEFAPTDADAAWARRDALISDTIADRDIEIVLLRAVSRADLLKTHARYFRSLQDVLSAA